MNHAFKMMCYCSDDNQERYVNARYYELKRNIFSSIMSESQSGEGNSQYGTVFIYNVETLICKKILKKKLKDYLNKGWKKGRRLNLKKDKYDAIKHFKGFLNSSLLSIRDYAKSVGVHRGRLSKIFKDHLNMSVDQIKELKEKQN